MNRPSIKWIGIYAVFLGGLLLFVINSGAYADQPQQVTSTPQSVVLPTSTATDLPPTPTETRTPTPPGAVLIEAKGNDTNVRAGPDITDDRLGVIQPGTQYIVRGRRFEWYQIEYPDTPSRIGWVHQSVVNVIGDVSLILEIDPALLPTIDLTRASQQETLLAATSTPGGFLTLTAAVQITPEGIFTEEATPGRQNRPTLAPGERLPTFTFPPFSPTPLNVQAIQGVNITTQEDEGLSSILPGSTFAPIIPIAGMAALGLMGLFVSLFRRL